MHSVTYSQYHFGVLTQQMKTRFSIHLFKIINRYELESTRERLQNLRLTLKNVKQTNDKERIQEIEDAISNCHVIYWFDRLLIGYYHSIPSRHSL